jgi:benzodiazapine receptor
MLLGSLIVTYSVAFIGMFFTVSAVDTWYPTLIKPALSPPNWIFGAVWTFLYALIAIAAWRIHGMRKSFVGAHRLLVVYGIHLVMNALWSAVFFGMQSPSLGLVVIALLWLFIAYLTITFYRHDRVAGVLFVPYLAWVSFASYLNFMIVLLN